MVDVDAILVTNAQRGDRAAFEELVRRMSRLVFARIYMEVEDPHRTEDLVQETFLVAWQKMRQVTDPGGFRSWLFAVAHSVTIDAVRRDNRKKRTTGRKADSEVLDRVSSNIPEPPEAVERAESRQKVVSVLRSLPDEYRMPLMLRYLTGADYETIGRQLGMSNGALRGMLNRGMELLRAAMNHGQ